MKHKNYLVDRFQFDEFEIELEFVVGEMVISQTVRPLDDFQLLPLDGLLTQIDNFHQT